jgi:hypothetical protein
VDAGRRIWVASGVSGEDGLRIEACRPGEALPGSGREREACLAALRDFIAAAPAGVFGLDFPFALPQSLMPPEGWEAFVATFPERYADAETFRETCRAATGGRELWRVTDRETKTPFCAYNWRLYRQTFYGIRDLLHPLVRDSLACVLPMQAPLPDRSWLLEICPAATLKRLSLYRPYKGRTLAHRAARVAILEAIERLGPLLMAPSLRQTVLDDAGGDALDSVVAAFTAYRVCSSGAALGEAEGEAYAAEGYVYSWSP